MTGIISGVFTPKDKTKLNPLTRQKFRIFLKSMVSSCSFPSGIRKSKLKAPMSYQQQIMEVKWTGVTNQQDEMINST